MAETIDKVQTMPIEDAIQALITAAVAHSSRARAAARAQDFKAAARAAVDAAETWKILARYVSLTAQQAAEAAEVWRTM